MAAEKQILTLDEFFTGQADSRQLFDALLDLIHTIGPAEIRVTKSQVAFWRQRAFAWAWMPGKYLQSRTAPPRFDDCFTPVGSLAPLETDC